MPAENRSLARQAVVQTVFECDFRGSRDDRQAILMRNLSALVADKKVDSGFAEKLLTAVCNREKEIRSLIEKYATEWPFDKISLLDRIILECGLAELCYIRGVPPAATLNEFVEIAKNYGGDSSRRFINGVLSAAQKDI